ncbi:MAG: uncharacterized protein H6Q89_4127 [Myxococcaceae bacterium]|nr:uncharacterized protein [Myxococcaceae bacterium]
MIDLEQSRLQMVKAQLERRGIFDPLVLAAFRAVPREAFVPDEMEEFAYQDTALPLTEGQTISQPYIVALTVEALQLRGGEKVLEIGTGSGYAAAILGRIAGEVFTVERLPALASSASRRLAGLGFHNVQAKCADGSLGWAEHAPYDAIAVSAGGPSAPPALLMQLAIGGRMVMPIGAEESSQVLMRITRRSQSEYESEPLSEVRFVPLIGEQGFAAPGRARARDDRSAAVLVREAAERIDSLDSGSVDRILDRIADARVVLIGEATHGTSEFYRMRARLTRELITHRGFSFVAVEADWPDAARVNEYVCGDVRRSAHQFVPFERFPTWMWRNEEVHQFIDWLKAHNEGRTEPKVGFHGLDLYSLFTSIDAVLHYLDRVDPKAAAVARQRYAALTPWQKDPGAYGRAVLVGQYKSSEVAAVAMLNDLLKGRLEYVQKDGAGFFDAAQNARVVANAERYYREMYYGSAASWNLRDSHMFETLRSLLGFYGPGSKGIIWEHNSHVGASEATEMALRGEYNVGQLCRTEFGDRAYLIGQGTDHGTVIAASDWDGPMERMAVRPSNALSYERIMHDSGVSAFTLNLRSPSRAALRDELMNSHLERAIGVIYRPQTERGSHYFDAVLPLQFDEYFWFDETHALHPLGERRAGARPPNELPDTYPFGL